MSIPPNIEEAWRTELAGLEARLARADDEQRANLERRIGEVKANLGELDEAVHRHPARGRRKVNGVEVRPDHGADETA